MIVFMWLSAHYIQKIKNKSNTNEIITLKIFYKYTDKH